MCEGKFLDYRKNVKSTLIKKMVLKIQIVFALSSRTKKIDKFGKSEKTLELINRVFLKLCLGKTIS